jgi:tRNA threonylcarbamoyladenosine biosynthesis protein TsaB
MKLLAFDTSTDLMSIAVSRDDGASAGLWQQQGEGGARASTSLIPGVLELMRLSGMELRELDAICFGCGPGSFTGLRTACSVAQGLAFGANVCVLPVNSLLAVAEEARYTALAAGEIGQVTAMLDARMDEIYTATFAFNAGAWTELQPATLLKPEAVALPNPRAGEAVAAGNAFAFYGERLIGLPTEAARIHALPQATAMLRLAPQLLAAGKAVSAEHALPTYVRDKVAQTTAERTAIKAALAATL